MKFLLKIVQGPNAGAEIALVEGVRVTLGSADSCDIVLADPTLPGEACAIEASADGVVLTPPGAAPESMEPLRVRSFGSTALAVGPADAPWGPLNWEAPAVAEPPAEAGEARPESAPPADADSATPDSTKGAEPEKDGAKSAEPAAPSRRRARRVGCLVLLLLLLLLLAFAAWKLLPRFLHASGTQPESGDGSVSEAPASGLLVLAERYGLTVIETNGTTLARGDFGTRAKRLAATAELYEAQPGIVLDLADRETLLASSADLLAAATDGALEIRDVTNRVAVLAGRAADPAALRAALDALRADVPRLAGVDTAAVTLDSPFAPTPAGAAANPDGKAPSRTVAARPAQPRLPLCGILLQPYPCLVLQNGQRLSEGAEVGGYKIVSIAPDRITVRRGEEEELEWTP